MPYGYVTAALIHSLYPISWSPLYGPCVSRTIMGGKLIDSGSTGLQGSDFTLGCWLTRHCSLYLVRPGGQRRRIMWGPAGTVTEQAA